MITLKKVTSESLLGFQPCKCHENQVVPRAGITSEGIGLASFVLWGVPPSWRRSPPGSTQKQSGCAAGYPGGATKSTVTRETIQPGPISTSGTVIRCPPLDSGVEVGA